MLKNFLRQLTYLNLTTCISYTQVLPTTITKKVLHKIQASENLVTLNNAKLENKVQTSYLTIEEKLREEKREVLVTISTLNDPLRFSSPSRKIWSSRGDLNFNHSSKVVIISYLWRSNYKSNLFLLIL